MFTIAGGMSKCTKTFFSRLGEMMAEKKASETRDTVLVERKAPPIIDYAVRIISKHVLASFP